MHSLNKDIDSLDKGQNQKCELQELTVLYSLLDVHSGKVNMAQLLVVGPYSFANIEADKLELCRPATN